MRVHIYQAKKRISGEMRSLREHSR